MADEKEKGSSGEMRRRHEAIVRSGALARLGSEGRATLVVALLWANYRTGEFRMSARGAATTSGLRPTTLRRGIAQLIAAGVIQPGQPHPTKRQLYRFVPDMGAHVACPPRTQVVRAPLTRVVRAPDTPCARGAHVACPERARSVSGARTTRVPLSSIVLNGSSRTIEADSPSGLPAVAAASREIT